MHMRITSPVSPDVDRARSVPGAMHADDCRKDLAASLKLMGNPPLVNCATSCR